MKVGSHQFICHFHFQFSNKVGSHLATCKAVLSLYLFRLTEDTYLHRCPQSIVPCFERSLHRAAAMLPLHSHHACCPARVRFCVCVYICMCTAAMLPLHSHHACCPARVRFCVRIHLYVHSCNAPSALAPCLLPCTCAFLCVYTSVCAQLQCSLCTRTMPVALHVCVCVCVSLCVYLHDWRVSVCVCVCVCAHVHIAGNAGVLFCMCVIVCV